MGEPCWSCGDGYVIRDPDSGVRVCSSCGIEHDSGGAEFVHQPTFTAFGQPDHTASSLIHHSENSYRERKLDAASALVSSIASRLGLSPSNSAAALRLALSATSGSLASPTSSFLPALAAACCLLVARSHLLPLSLAEAAAAASCPPASLANLASRVATQLSLPPLPAFDASAALERAVRSSPSLSAATEKADRILAHGHFLLCCAAKWALSTGRNPLPLVAAIATFAAHINGVMTVSLEDVARDIYAGISTSRRRFKELTDTLVRVAKAVLPWGEDVNARNLVMSAPLLLRLMEMRTRAKPSDGFLEGFALDTSNVMGSYTLVGDDEAKYFFQLVPTGDDGNVDWDNFGEDDSLPEDFKISKERLSDAYQNVLKKVRQLKEAGEIGKGTEKRKKWSGGLELETWINFLDNKSSTVKNMTLEEIMSMDVGYDAPPPSFSAGLELRRERRGRIEAARHRIELVKKGPRAVAATEGVKKDDCPAEKVVSRKQGRKRRGASDHIDLGDLAAVGTKRRRKKRDTCNGVDWEDCVIELMLLHGIDESEIEQGQYKRLLDLHVFGASSADC